MLGIQVEIDRLGLLLAGSIVLTSCANPQSEDPLCSCTSYMPSKPQPDWVLTESTASGVYKSQGIGQCTGLQSLDIEEADITARANLGRMLSSQIESEVLLVRTDLGEGTGKSEGKISSRQSSAIALEHSVIYDHWVGPISCTIHSAVRVSQADIQAALKKQEREINAALRNQVFSVNTQGAYSDVLHRSILQMLSDAGITKVRLTSNADGYQSDAFIFKAEVTDQEWLNNGRLARVNVNLYIEAPDGSVIWIYQTTGKGMSYSTRDRNYLVKLAIKQAGQNASQPFQQALSKNVRDIRNTPN